MELNKKKLLESEDYFFCERAHCILRKEICIRRQDSNKKFGKISFDICEDCAQGKEIKREASHKALRKPENRVKTEKGSFVSNQIEKPRMSKVAPKESKMSKCKQCGKKFKPYKHGGIIIKTICKECMRIRQYTRRVKKEATVMAVLKSDYPDVLDFISKEAQKNIRSTLGQIIWLLRECKNASENKE